MHWSQDCQQLLLLLSLLLLLLLLLLVLLLLAVTGLAADFNLVMAVPVSVADVAAGAAAFDKGAKPRPRSSVTQALTFS